MGLSIDISLMSSCCSSDNIEACSLDVDIEENEKDGCCDNNACDCLCCGHIFINPTVQEVSSDDNPFLSNSIIPYRNAYFFQIRSMVWHPPKK